MNSVRTRMVKTQAEAKVCPAGPASHCKMIMLLPPSEVDMTLYASCGKFAGQITLQKHMF
ncbi:hypothetical protein GCM10010911_12090 [Paenibacillus nasutitermitis]|uniref:Uncharacterized protein n=1 Tax=Paenibacillus nasutitermitis TaxID=1652958 RepID=A0A916YRC5_9BACL|nr:hypothetical protein GCM10010911_12090 [Paenibacillus nasutitermitis]